MLGKGMYGMNRKGWKKMVIKGNGSYLLRDRIKGKGGQGKGSSFSLLNLFDSAVILSTLHEGRITEEYKYPLISASTNEYRPLKTKYGPNKDPIFFHKEGPCKYLDLVF